MNANQETQQQSEELEVRTNQQIKELHKKKLQDLAEQEYQSKKISSVLPQLEGLLLLYQKQNIIKNESDLQYVTSEINQYPIIKQYQMKNIQPNVFCQHFMEQMQYTFIQLGDQLQNNCKILYLPIQKYSFQSWYPNLHFQKYFQELMEDYICFLLKGKVSIYQEKTTSQIEENFIEYFKVYYHQVKQQIKENSIQQKLDAFMSEVSSQADKKNSKVSFQITKQSSQEKKMQWDESVQQINSNQTQRKQSNLTNQKQLTQKDYEHLFTRFHNIFSKEELRILQSLLRELIIKEIFQLIDQQEHNQMNFDEQQQKLLLWYQPRTDYYFNEWGIPKYYEIKSFFSGEHFYSMGFFQDKACLLIAADDSHMLTMKKSQYESLSNYQPDQQKEKFQFIGEIFKDLSKNTVLKFIYNFKKKEFKRKQHIWRQNEKVDGIYFIQSGEVEYLKSQKTKKNQNKKHDSKLQKQEIELIIKNDQKVQLLQVCSFIQGNFIGEEDLFESHRQYSVIVKSETVTVQYLSIEDLGNIKNLISEIYIQLTKRVEQKKRNLDQKLKIAVQLNLQKGEQECIADMLSNPQGFKSQKFNDKNQRKEIQKLIEEQENKKFTDTNDIKQIDKLIRSEFGKKKYLQMIQENPQVILSNSTLNSLESVMSFTDLSKKQEKGINTPQQKQVKNGQKQLNSSLNQISDETQQNQKKDLKSQMMKQVKNVMKINKFINSAKHKQKSQNTDNGDNSSQASKNDQNELDTIFNGQEVSNQKTLQSKLSKVQTSVSNSLQNSNQQLFVSSQITGNSESVNTMPKRERQNKLTDKEKQMIQSQKLEKEINSSKFKNLKLFLSEEQIQHLAAKKLKQKESYQERNKLTFFEQQQIKESLSKKTIRPGQKNLLNDEQKIQMKAALHSLLLSNSEKLEKDFIFKGVQTQQSMKQLQLKMYQRLSQKPGMQNLCYSPNNKSKRNSKIYSTAVSRKHSQQIEMINLLSQSQTNSPLIENSPKHFFTQIQTANQTPLQSNNFIFDSQTCSPQHSTQTFSEQMSLKLLRNRHSNGNDSIIEENKPNLQFIQTNSLSVNTSYSFSTEQLNKQNKFTNNCVHRRVQSGNPRVQQNKSSSPIKTSNNPKYLFSSITNKQTRCKLKPSDGTPYKNKSSSIQHQLNYIKQYNFNLETSLSGYSQNYQRNSKSQMIDSSNIFRNDSVFQYSLNCNSPAPQNLTEKYKHEPSFSNIIQISDSSASNIKRENTTNQKSIEKNLQNQINPYLNQLLEDNQILSMNKINLQNRASTSQIFTNLNAKNSFMNVQINNKMDEKSPLVIKSLQINDFMSFDQLRSIPNSRPNSAQIKFNTSPTYINQQQNNIFIPTDVSYQNYSSLAFAQKEQSQNSYQRSPNQSSCLSQLKNTLNLNYPLTQVNRKYQHYSNIHEQHDKTNLYKQKLNLTCNQNSPKTNNNQKQKILPFQRIHSATARQKIKKNTVINQIISQYKKSNGLILVPNDLLVLEEFQNSKIEIK